MSKKRDAKLTAESARIAELEAEVASKDAEAKRYYRMLESINKSTHLAIWMAYFDEQGQQTGVRFTDEMRRALGYS
ncbi:MAG: hypothetical protein IJ807_01675, partial [Eubacterium sp.]|nr:hypothetical protein [Eubacterium sp.]